MLPITHLKMVNVYVNFISINYFLKNSITYFLETTVIILRIFFKIIMSPHTQFIFPYSQVCRKEIGKSLHFFPTFKTIQFSIYFLLLLFWEKILKSNIEPNLKH